MDTKHTASDTKTEVDYLATQLNKKMDELRTCDGYQDYLRMQARFPHYSLNNCLLIITQMPQATHVAGYTVWSSLGRHVKAGEHGIRIMAPRICKRAKITETSVPPSGLVESKPSVSTVVNADSKSSDTQFESQSDVYMYFRPISVFDISQTSGDPLPTLTVDELQGRVDGYTIFKDSLIESSPVPVRFSTIPDGTKGYYSPITNEIVIKIGMSEQQTLKTLAHELGHSVAHSPDNPIAMKKTRSDKETEAESIAYIICSHYGIETDSYSFPYIGTWASTMSNKELSARITSIKGPAVEIIDRTDDCIQRRLSEHRTEIAYQLPDGYISVQKESSRDSINYHLYDLHYQQTHSGQLHLPPQISIQAAAEQVLLNRGLDPQRKHEFPLYLLQEGISHARQDTLHHMH